MIPQNIFAQRAGFPEQPMGQPGAVQQPGLQPNFGANPPANIFAQRAGVPSPIASTPGHILPPQGPQIPGMVPPGHFPQYGLGSPPNVNPVQPPPFSPYQPIGAPPPLPYGGMPQGSILNHPAIQNFLRQRAGFQY